MVEGRLTRALLRGGALLTLAFIYVPLLLIALYAFNENVTQAWPIENYSTKWFSVAYHNEDVREALNGIFYVLATGCRWRARPKDLPPRSTVHDCLTLGAWDGTLKRLHQALLVRAREPVGKEASPTAAIIDSQGVKGAEKGALASIRRATTRARGSKARSGTSWSTRSARC